MRSADEPGSREEDTIPVQCRDMMSEGGGYGTRLSDRCYMYSISSVDNTDNEHVSHAKLQGLEKNAAPLEGRAEPHGCGINSARRERSGVTREEENTRCVRGHIDVGCLANN